MVSLGSTLDRVIPTGGVYIADFDRILEERSKSQEFITYPRNQAFSPGVILEIAAMHRKVPKGI